jgi:hypothetical protein
MIRQIVTVITLALLHPDYSFLILSLFHLYNSCRHFSLPKLMKYNRVSQIPDVEQFTNIFISGIPTYNFSNIKSTEILYQFF